MNGKKAKQARRLTAQTLSYVRETEPEKLKIQHLNLRQHLVPHPLTGESFGYETATLVNPRRRAYREIKKIIRQMPRLV